MGFCRVLVLLVATLLPTVPHAVQVQIGLTAPFVYIQVGHGIFGSFGLFGPPAGQVDEVNFAFPVGVQPGDGTPIIGTPTIPIALLGYSGGGQANFRVTMDSSVPLSNASGDTLPFSKFSWTTQDGDISSGQFDDSANQLLQQYNYVWPRGRGVIDYLTFTYTNDQVYQAGTYSGRVTYTITEL